jgi:PAS domain S-box-containing protein
LAANTATKKEIDAVLDFISSLESGNLSPRNIETEDPALRQVIDRLNSAAEKLGSRASSSLQARLDALFTQSADPIMTLAPPSWNFTGCNPAALKLFKISSREEFVRLGPGNLSPERQPDGSLSSQKAPQVIAQAMQTGSHFFEWDHVTSAGEVVACTVLLSRVDVAGESYLQATVRDVTQEKQREREFKSIFWESPLGIVRLDSQYRFLSVNPAYQAFLGYSEGELQSMSLLDLIHPDDRAKTLEMIQNPRAEGAGVLRRFEKRYIHKSGRTIWGKVNRQSIPDSNGELTFLTIVEDITEQKEIEMQTTTILNTMAEGLVMQNSKGVIEAFNPAALSVLGLTEDQMRGRTSMDPAWRAVKEDRTPFPGEEHPAMVALATGRPVKGVVMGLVLPDQTERWIKINAIPFEGTAGRRVACTFSDVTELFNAQTEIRFVLDSLKIGVWKFNPTDQSLFWDKSMYSLFDVKQSDFSGHYQAWESTLTAESKKNAVDELGRALSGEKEFDTVFEIETKSRGRRFISGRAKVIRDETGKPLMMYGVNMDVTTQKKGEMDRERISALFEIVLQNIPSIIFVKDYTNSSKFSLVNKAAEQLFGMKKEQIVGKSDFDLFPSQASFFTSMDKEVFNSHAVLKIDREEIDTPAGKRYLQTYKVPTFGQNNEPHLIIGISNDITEELKIKKDLEMERSKSLQNAKLASLGEMSAGIAHEINNPLAIISGSVGLLAKYADNPEKLASKVETIQKSCIRIARIVEGLKKFSRSGDKANLRDYELSKIVQDGCVLTEAKSKRHSTPVELDLKSASRVSCDEVEIEQVLINLINNAIDAVQALPQKWVKVSLFDEGAFVVLRVTDSGCGIAEDVREKLFEPFFTTKKVGEGTGLGLSITKGILDEHKATITVVANSPNTCFEIRFPRVEEAKNAA